MKEHLIHNIDDIHQTIVMRINLITGASSPATGRIKVEKNGWYDDEDMICDGEITTGYDGKKAGMAFKKIRWTEYLGETDYTIDKESDQEDVISEKGRDAYTCFNDTFAIWNKMITKKHTKLKKAGISMKSIGFSKWK